MEIPVDEGLRGKVGGELAGEELLDKLGVVVIYKGLLKSMKFK